MRWYRNSKISIKIIVISSIIMFLMLSIVAINFFFINHSKIDVETISISILSPLEKLEKVSKNNMGISKDIHSMRNLSIGGNSLYIKEMNRISDNIIKKYDENISYMKEVEGKLDEKILQEDPSIIEIFDDINSYNVSLNSLRGAILQGNDKNINKKIGLLISQSREENLKLGNLKKHMIDAGKEIFQENRSYHSMYFTILVVFLLLVLVANIIIAMLFTGSITKPIKKILELAKGFAHGDFTNRVDFNSRDEFGELSDTLNQSADILENTIIEITSVFKELFIAIEEITSGNANLSRRTTEQAAALEEVASSIAEITKTVNLNAENSKIASRLVGDTSNMAIKGGEISEEAAKSINEVNGSSKKIEEIITVIDSIAFQTNLLSLNAAVEAARAGEQGRGFAVVAGEVRSLAQRSARSAKEIKELIKNSLSKITIGTELSTRSGDSLEEIIGSVKYLDNFIGEIADSSEEQQTGMEQINRAVIELDRMTQENASLVEHTATSSADMKCLSNEVTQLMEKFTTGEIKKIESESKESSTIKDNDNGVNISDEKSIERLLIEDSPLSRDDEIILKDKSSNNDHGTPKKNRKKTKKILPLKNDFKSDESDLKSYRDEQKKKMVTIDDELYDTSPTDSNLINDDKSDKIDEIENILKEDGFEKF